MKSSIRRQLRILQIYAAASFAVVSFLLFTAFTQSPAPQRIDELTVQRLNVVDANGTLRFVLSNKDRMHPGVMDGVTINRPRPVAGMLFFNDEGDEVGGLTYTGTDDNGRRANAGIMFDQLKQDQTIGISYNEGNGQRSAGLQVWDRSEQPLSDLIKGLNAANALPEGPQRDEAVKAVRAKAPPGPRRLFVGKNTDKAATVSLADANGKPRLVMTVTADGAASIDFLDAGGKTVQRIPARQ
ncbi:MAG TPA: hypothetical protein VEA16_07960 [Vicinamibacterales bacterium]|nr:hypothetical protein [Vicinamibacterales bacterium]